MTKYPLIDPSDFKGRTSVSRDEIRNYGRGGDGVSAMGRTRKGQREDLPWSCDSGWEANIGRVLLWLQGQGHIRRLERLLATADAPWLEFAGVEHGTTRTLLDFRFKPTEKTPTDLSIPRECPSGWVWVEVKGRLDPKSKTRLNRVRKYHRDIWESTIFVVGRDRRAGGGLGRRRAKTTAHAYLESMAFRENIGTTIWLYDDMKKLFGHLVNWEG